MDRLLLLAGVLLSMFYMTFAYDFYVGGKQGWVVNPQESYDLWAVNMRFQVNDKLGKNNPVLNSLILYNFLRAYAIIFFLLCSF